jgi:hypothetical protein
VYIDVAALDLLPPEVDGLMPCDPWWTCDYTCSISCDRSCGNGDTYL